MRNQTRSQRIKLQLFHARSAERRCGGRALPYKFQGLQAPAFGSPAKVDEAIRSKTVSLGDEMKLAFEQVEFLLKDNASAKETSVFFMQTRLAFLLGHVFYTVQC